MQLITKPHQSEIITQEESDEKEKFINAASYGNLNEIKVFSTKFGQDMELSNKALYFSCVYNHLEVVKWLMNNTALSTKIKGLYTPLTAACENNCLDIVKYLVNECHFEVNLPNLWDGETPLTWACYYDKKPLIHYLLREISCLEINVASKRNNTALHYIILCEDDTALHRACHDGNVRKVYDLVYVSSHTHELNAQNNEGNAPLHIACFYGHADIVEALMVAGAETTLINDDGETPAQVAIKAGHDKLLGLLDLNSLWQNIIINYSMKRMFSGLLAVLALKLMKHKIVKTKWYRLIRLLGIVVAVSVYRSKKKPQETKIKYNNCVLL